METYDRDKTNSCWRVFPALEYICKHELTASNQLSKYLGKQIWSPSDRQEILEKLALLFVQNKDRTVCNIFKPLLLDIVSRSQISLGKDGIPFRKHQDFCIALSLCLSRPDIQRFTIEYMKDKPSFLKQNDNQEPKKKKAKKNRPTEEVLCQAAWMFTCYLGDAATSAVQLEDLLPYLSHEKPDIRWFACQAVMEHQRMLSVHRETFLHKHFSEKEIRRLTIRHSGVCRESANEAAALCVLDQVCHQSHTEHLILDTDLCDTVTCVGGVLLQKVAPSDTQKLDLLPVPSNQSNLHSLAMAVSMGTPVLLQGVVGSGKTTLVEHLAKLTGRQGPPHLMKIQLGDQMDSKALLGTYRCTEVPGEFVWQPGVLTQAVTQGYWVLLEDIDYAPMEVISVLLPLLETGTLSVPGHGDNVRASPGFHLFATQRLVSSKSGWQRQHTSNSGLLDKLWTTILVEPLSRTELAQVLCTKFPMLETVIDKLLDIYFLLSAGDHQGALDVTIDTDTELVGKFLSHDGRLISTRDLMTWCWRIAHDFDISSTATANLVFQEAVDCFVACLSKPAKRMPLAEAIGAKLNVTKVKAEYFCQKYKPDVKISPSSFSVGRVALPIKEAQVSLHTRGKSMFSYTRQSSMLLERVAVSVSNREPVLLVGETGTGKTSSVQYLAEQLGHRLHVINMNQQSDSADLLGGFKPVDLRHIVKPFCEDFEIQFCKSFSRKQNAKFLGHLQDTLAKRKWDTLFSLMEHTKNSALKKAEKESSTFGRRWEAIGRRLAQLRLQVQQTQNALAFTFMEGTLVKAIRNGDWVLLDEINLAAMETLECLSGLLESTTGSVLLMERGDIEPVVRHEDFRLFACMNPATDVGKKDLSPGIRNRFTELFVDELEDKQDLQILVSDYLRGLSLTAAQVDGIVKFYTIIKTECNKKLTDGTGHQPHYSLRTLCRALRYAALNRCGSVARSLYEGFCLSFLTQLDRGSHPVVEQLVCQHVIGRSNVKSVVKQELPAPPGGKCLKFEGYWISVGALETQVPEGYILTPSVRANLKDLARVVSAGQHPVLIQGETSVGKTSLIKWLAQSSGNVCVRVNNHEHTDLQEYVGCYAADERGKLVFKEGVLVEAMRKGEWIILDELNLAPTDVLEALNRLLDDNRELYIPETQETVKAHPKFMLFATQNPPGHYGGRKMLSRAFRNRFVELHFDEIPSTELQTILHERCNIPLSYAKRLVAAMLELQTRRRGSGVFAGKMGFMTLRDLFRWAERYTCPEMDGKRFYDWDKHLADQGYMLLAGRVRKPEEAGVIQEVIQKHFKCKISPASLYTLNSSTSLTTKSMLEKVLSQSAEGFQHVVWTQSLRRMAVLIGQAIKYQEPVLLVGETGCGKTTMCQMYAALYLTKLHGVNCHLHTESADFLGGLRPVRSHTEEDKKDKLFEWVDGPLVKAMKEGSMFLIDEISLADDSVLERLNSVLEPERTILLAEKGGGEGLDEEVEQVTAGSGFHVFATMNPGGDFGKKELSPALRNRFTEIWCPPSNQRQDLIDIIEHNLNAGIHLCNQEDGTSGIGRAIMDFVDWFSNNELGKRCTVSIRDILTWVRFINSCSKTIPDDIAMETDQPSYNRLDPAVAYIHGACLVFLDGLGAGTTSQGRDDIVTQLRAVALTYLLKQVNSLTHQDYKMFDLYLLDNRQKIKNVVMETESEFCIPPFSIPRGDLETKEALRYALEAPGTCVNAQRVLRALQLPRPLLLEGSPGVGKTSLVSAIAKAAGRRLVRINLSEQTDVTDLFGADLPVEGAEGGVFAWRDGPLLQALKAGSWIVLDELNLASQSVLEGLNACLDHRAEVYVPELGKTFQIQHENTRLFACQNPLNQGGGRKGLPRSFLNRFTQVYVEPLSEADLMFIAGSMYPDIPTQTLGLMVQFNMQMYEETVMKGLWGQRGSPWEFNLRDLFRWCDLLLQNQGVESINPGEYISLVYADRMRTQADKQQVYRLYESMFPDTMEAYRPTGVFHCGTSTVQVGHSFHKVNVQGRCHGDGQVAMEILHQCLSPMESLLKCVEMNWMVILVGPPSSGKSSVVEMLSQLTGNQLNVLAMNSAMDTTELLGGFEQADVGRHIEELAAEVNKHILTLSQACLLASDTGSLDTVTKLQSLWKDYTQCTATGDKATTVEELEVLRGRVASLLAAVSACKTVAVESVTRKVKVKEISKLRKRIKAMKQKLSLAVPGQGGGAFEWTDSILVKSLKLGQWLLIDNVNFCSASVLDRLNALLEPNGVLSINERGVIDGEIPTIKPHRNFRLFLSMDPRHGEISRAMRNRGLEIYLPGEEDGGALSDLDRRLMLSSKGLTSKEAFDWLQKLQHDLREELPMGDKPSLQSLLQVCQHLVSHGNHGYGMREALEIACNCVYIQRQRHRESKQMASATLTKHLDMWPTEESESPGDVELGLSPVRIPNLVQYVQDPGRSKVMKNVAVLVHLLETSMTSSGVDLRVEVQQKHALCHLLGRTSEDSLQYTADWLQNYVTNSHKIQALNISKYGVDSLQEICTQIQTALGDLKYRNLMDQFDTDSSESSLDWQWNMQMMQRIVQTGDPTNRSTLVTDLTTTSNRLHTLVYFWVEMELLRKSWQSLQQAVQKDKDRGRPSLHEAVTHLVAMFPVLTSAIAGCIPNTDMTSYSAAAKAVECFSCIRRLYEVTVETLGTSQALSQLPLYWKWLHSNTLSIFMNSQSDQKLLAIVTTLQSMLGKDDRKWKQFVKFWRSWGHPRPFQNDREAHYYTEATKVNDLICLHGNSTELLDKAKVKLILSQRNFIVKIMKSLMTTTDQSNQEDQDDLENNLTLLLAQLTSHGLYSKYSQSGLTEMDTNEDGLTTETDVSKGDHSDRSQPIGYVQLWPLFEYSSVVESWSLLTMVLSGDINQEYLQTFLDFNIQFSPMQPVDVIRLQKLSQDNLEGELSAVMTSILTRLRTSTVTNQQAKWLTWPIEQEQTTNKQKCLHSMTLTAVLYTLLSRANPALSTSKPPNLELSTPLKTHSREITQLSSISRHVWSHVSSYKNPSKFTRVLDNRGYCCTLKHTLHSLKPLLPVQHIPEFTSALDTGALWDISTDSLQSVSQVLSTALSTSDPEPVTLVTMTQICLETAGQLLGDNTGDLGLLGAAWVHLGLLGMHLLSPKGPVDPVEKVHIKLRILKEELVSVESELSVLCMYHRLVTGQELSVVSSRLVHPRVPYLYNRVEELMLQIEGMSKQLAYRPPVSQYNQLVQDVENYMDSIGSVETVDKLTNKMKKQIKRTTTGSGLQQEVELWVKSQESFVSMIQQEYQVYRDIIAPFVCAVNQMLHGVHVLYHTLRQNHQLHMLSKTLLDKPKKEDLRNSLERLVLAVGRFPTVTVDHPSCSQLAGALSDESCLSLMKAVVSHVQAERQDQASLVSDSVLNSSLLHLLNEARIVGNLAPDLVVTLTHILELYVLSWQQEEQARRDREESEASMYRFKSQEHGDDRTEEEIDEEEFKKTFPAFTQDFADLVESTSLEDSPVTQEDEDSPQLQVTDLQMRQIFWVHQKLFKHLVSTDWYTCSAQEAVMLSDWVKPVLSSYTSAARLGNCLTDVLGSHVDGELLGSHLVLSTVQQHHILQTSQQAGSPLLEDVKLYDIYHDSNVPEVLHCVPVLKAVTDRALELLAEWPDHPTLKQVVEITERIESLPVTAPVMKFLTGLELLLEKAQHWECNAASFVSMATQLADVSGLIVQWRKLELSCWSQLLDQEVHRYQTAASKWWFHLYQLIHAVLTPQESETTTTTSDIIKSLKQFMEQATLGDYPTRLDMLLTFHCHLVTMETSDSQRELMTVLWNLHQFYSRFSSAVQTELDKLKAPIDKELKGFVKIARWSDINYWALKQATEKTHRTLHKHLKKFQNVLRQQVQGILGETEGGDTVLGAGNSVWRDKLSSYQEELLRQLNTYKVGSLELDTEVVEVMSSWAPVLQRPSQLCTKFNKHWRQTISAAQYSQLLVSLDEFTGEVIEEIHELQSLEVNRSDEKAKQKSEAKHFNLRKRKALSDLFKYLAKLGLSYRKGLALEDSDSDAALLVPPLDLGVAMNSDAAVQCVWEGCLGYYYRCISRKAQFASAIVSPSKELGIGNIERSKGFTSHLFHLLKDQYLAVEQKASQYKHLQCAIHELEGLCKGRLLMVSQDEAKEWRTKCTDLAVKTIEGLNQFLVILHCCPRQQGEITAHPSPISAKQLHQMALVNVEDEVVSETIKNIQDALKDVEHSWQKVKAADSSLVTWSDITDIQHFIQQLHSKVPVMQSVSKLFCDPDSSHPNAFTSVLHFLSDEITNQVQLFSTWYTQVEHHNQSANTNTDEVKIALDSEEMDTFSQQTEKLVSSILMALQKSKKHHVTIETEDTDKAGVEDEEDVIKDGHLVRQLFEKLKLDGQALDVCNITASLSKLTTAIVKGDNLYSAERKRNVLQSCLPIIHQFKGMLHHQMISNIATQRLMGKLLSVLFGVFTELATKGFCIPPELSEEMEGEGATEFCDMENAGIGEGEGVKNVSDQIEDEDQLDEAKRPEDHKKDEDDDHPDVKSEEKAIEMSEDFDAKVQDLEDVDKEEDNEEDENDDKEEEVDKEMGDVDEDQTDKLDEQMWGSDEEDEADNEDKKEEKGAGDGTQSQPELVAKEENQDKEDAEEGDRKDDKQEPENENQQPNNLDQLDQENYDDDQVDPYHGEQKEEKQAPEDLDLPDDLELDDAGSDTEGKEEQQEEKMEENGENDETKLPPEETPEQTEELEEPGEEDAKNPEEAEDGENDKEKEEKEADSGDRQEEEGSEDPGLAPEDDSTVEQQEGEEQEDKADDNVQAVEDYGKTSHDTECAEQSDTARDQAGQAMENNQQEIDGTGQASSDQIEGHQGQRSSRAADVSSEGKRKQERQPGKSDSERSLGSTEQKYKKLKTTDTRESTREQENQEEKESDLYEHVKDPSAQHDAQALDVATAEQQEKQGQIQPENQEEEEETADTEMAEDNDNEEDEELGPAGDLQSLQLKKKSKQEADVAEETDDDLDVDGSKKHEIAGDKVTTATVTRGPESTIHTALEHLHLDNVTFDLESLRTELEGQLGAWNQPNLPTDRSSEMAASELWHRYEVLTSSLAQDLCEQLRLVLEPSQATKLRGDYRTGKRLNMRKVIPYIASQFRKDKIWLRRTKPSKRQYQIMLAVDDSSSMVDNHSKQMAFESLALISNALTLLEVGQLSICSFGETVNGLHPFTEQFSSQSGAHLLQYLTFEQKKTKIAQLLKYATSEMLEARQRQHGGSGNPETSQLLLIMSDGRGLFMEGMEVVKTAVRQAREANVFIVFVIIDNPVNKDSILDIKVPVFKSAGQVPEIKSYMDSFPFPFYIILRDINSLPIVLSDALRQWFELVTAVDR